jgi:hypothetical protein
MKITIIGLAQAGQQELFSLLTGMLLETIKLKPLEVHQGICEVKDPRVTKLSEMYKPKKTTYARIEYQLMPDFSLTGPTKDIIFRELKNADEICFVTHEATAEKDVKNFISELILFDMMLVEKRLEGIAKDQRKKFSDVKEKESALMENFKRQLEGEEPLKKLALSPDLTKAAETYQFFTMKPVFIVVNVSEDKIKDTTIAEKISGLTSYPCVQLSAEIEQEIGKFNEEERSEFMKDMGITEPAIVKMTIVAYAELGLISFFTVGEDEVRAWTIKKGATAPEAGKTIHSDIQKGFVRAEMFKYNDLLFAASEARLKETGKFHLKGKDYVVEDGDILNFRFNV